MPDSSPIVASVDLRNRCLAIRDQGPRGTCLAFALTAAHEFARKANFSTIELSEEYLYWACKQIQTSNSGMSIATAEHVLQQRGQIERQEWVYAPTIDENSTDYMPPSGVDLSTVHYKADFEDTGLKIDAIKTILHTASLIVASIYVCDNLFRPRLGFIAMPTNVLPSAHAVVIVGYFEVSPGDGHFIIRNSWGNAWGEQGYGYLPYEYILRFCRYARLVTPKST